MKTYIKYLLVPLFSLLLMNVKGQAMEELGSEISFQLESPHPYSGNSSNSYQMIWSDQINLTNASYIAVHFDQLKLTSEDYLIIRDPSNTIFWKYEYNEIENKSNSFWSIPISGDLIIIELFSKNSSGEYGVLIDKVAKGFEEFSISNDPLEESICGIDDSRNSICYEVSEPEAYQKSTAVARLIINGTSGCTAWLVGDEGHILTNEHCISSQEDADNITVEFDAEGTSCNSNCNFGLACRGTIEATSATLIKVDAHLDYALLKLDKNVSSKYGYLRMRQSGASLNERIYIPQHPQAWGKRIALFSSNSSDGGFAKVNTVEATGCNRSGNNIGYNADTQGGSSGSPVLGYDDNLVIALHNCGGCHNSGIPIELVINDLGSDLPHNGMSCSLIANATFESDINNMMDIISTHKREELIINVNVGFDYTDVKNDDYFELVATPSICVLNNFSNEIIRESAITEVSISDEFYSEASILSKTSFTLSPNPVNNGFTISGLDGSLKSYSISNNTGEEVIDGEILNNEFIDVENLSPGIYIITIMNENNIIAEKFIKL